MEKLTRVLDNMQEIQRLEEKIEQLTAIAEKVTTIISSEPKGNSGNPKDDVWANLIDTKSLYSFKLATYLFEAERLEDELDTIEDRNIRTAMKYYYLDGLTQAEISGRTGYDERSVRRFLSEGRKIYVKKFDYDA